MLDGGGVEHQVVIAAKAELVVGAAEPVDLVAGVEPAALAEEEAVIAGAAGEVGIADPAEEGEAAVTLGGAVEHDVLADLEIVEVDDEVAAGGDVRIVRLEVVVVAVGAVVAE